jgi:hypothetical protein
LGIGLVKPAAVTIIIMSKAAALNGIVTVLEISSTFDEAGRKTLVKNW